MVCSASSSVILFLLGLNLAVSRISADSEFTKYRSSLLPFSTSGSEVAGQHLLLDTFPSQTYTHYMQWYDPTVCYNFTIHVRQNGTGMFFTSWELTQNEAERNTDSGTRTNVGAGRQEKKSEICSRYQVKLSYPQNPGKQPTYLCKMFRIGEYNNDMSSWTKLEDYTGPGTVFVEVTLVAFLMGSEGLPDPFLSVRGLADQPLVSTSGRSIPSRSIGGLTFTLYQDCSEPEAKENTGVASTATAKGGLPPRPGIRLRPCSNYHNHSCIASDLFCNGETNCVTTLLDLVLHPDGLLESGSADEASSSSAGSKSGVDADSGSSSSYVEFRPSYDESQRTCGSQKGVWKQKVYTYSGSSTNSRAYAGSSGDGNGGIIGGAIVLIFGVCCTMARAMRNKEDKARAGVGAGVGRSEAV